jgi:hypothetical protein
LLQPLLLGATDAGGATLGELGTAPAPGPVGRVPPLVLGAVEYIADAFDHPEADCATDGAMDGAPELVGRVPPLALGAVEYMADAVVQPEADRATDGAAEGATDGAADGFPLECLIVLALPSDIGPRPMMTDGLAEALVQPVREAAACDGAIEPTTLLPSSPSPSSSDAAREAELPRFEMESRNSSSDSPLLLFESK